MLHIKLLIAMLHIKLLIAMSHIKPAPPKKSAAARVNY